MHSVTTLLFASSSLQVGSPSGLLTGGLSAGEVGSRSSPRLPGAVFSQKLGSHSASSRVGVPVPGCSYSSESEVSPILQTSNQRL